jgi:hypothetical protein
MFGPKFSCFTVLEWAEAQTYCAEIFAKLISVESQSVAKINKKRNKCKLFRLGSSP